VARGVFIRAGATVQRVPRYAALGITRLRTQLPKTGYAEDAVPRHPAPGTRLDTLDKLEERIIRKGKGHL